MHELCEARTGNYDCFNWKQGLFGERLPKKYSPKIKIWHLLRGITLQAIWIEQNDKVFNHKQWHETRVKHHIWDEHILYAKTAWERVLKISAFSAMGLLQGLDKTWGTRNVLCRRHNLHIEWNWKKCNYPR